MEAMPFPEPNTVIQAICNRYGICHDALLDGKRDPRTAHVRMIVVHYFREHRAISFSTLGKLVGKDSVTVVDIYKKATVKLNTDDNFRAELAQVQREISGCSDLQK
ncbi:hypothetical protein LJC63_04175 [Ruminococcaceae bacterium OttesenSCG-928-L11]|nr:hypothetical protein [Ruminococcaceae bacterium OttesenSCG-928-L11]